VGPGACIYFNQQCLKEHLIPSYAKIKIPNTSPAHKYTQHKITSIGIKNEIIYLHCKNQQLNLQLYNQYSSPANMWNNTWPHIHDNIAEKLRREARAKYRTLDRKLERLNQKQWTNRKEPFTFYPRVVNNSSIPFTRCETTLLQKGLKYNLHAKSKNRIQILALEAETAISLLPSNERDVYRKLVADQIDTLNRTNPTQNTQPEKTIR